ncbi:hypothetical protein IP70_15775 [alpha proteobacterium AAP38]|nr:hypothetical protein IP70_15775 [alpha proteobacterium AAP38]
MTSTPSINEIIDSCGGAERIACETDQTEWSVAKWVRNGIPEKHWSVLRRLNPLLSVDVLHGVNEAIRLSRGKGGAEQSADAA